MKRLYLIFLLFLILSPSTSFGGSFYNPDPEELRKEGQEAAEKLNASFVNFYQMLKNIEGNKFDIAQQDKNAFDKSLKKDALPMFVKIFQKATDRQLRFTLTPQLERNLAYIKKEFYKNQEIDTQKKLTELPVTLIGHLLEKSARFEIKPKETDFFPKLRSLIMATLDVQWVGIKISELWAVSIYK